MDSEGDKKFLLPLFYHALIVVLTKSSKTKSIVILLCYPHAGFVPSLLPHARLQCAQPHMCVLRLSLGGRSVTYFKMTFKR
jgi:hypothetical protein